MSMARQRSKPQVNKYGTLYFNVTVPEELTEQTITLFNAGYDPNDMIKEGIRNLYKKETAV